MKNLIRHPVTNSKSADALAEAILALLKKWRKHTSHRPLSRSALTFFEELFADDRLSGRWLTYSAPLRSDSMILLNRVKVKTSLG